MRSNRFPATSPDNWRVQFQGPAPVVESPLGAAVLALSGTLESIQELMIDEPTEISVGTWSTPFDPNDPRNPGLDYPDILRIEGMKLHE